MGIKKFFFKESEENKKINPPVPNNKPNFQSVPTSFQSTELHAFTMPSDPIVGSVKQDIIDYFEKVLSDSNLPGADYFEFRKALAEMKNQATDEASKYKMLWVGFKAMGLTTDKLIEAAVKYKEIFATKLAGFDSKLNVEIANNVDQKMKESVALEDENKKIEEEMQKLTAKKNSNIDQIKALTSEASTNSAALASKRADWHKVYDDMVKEIDTHIENINKYITN